MPNRLSDFKHYIPRNCSQSIYFILNPVSHQAFLFLCLALSQARVFTSDTLFILINIKEPLLFHLIDTQIKTEGETATNFERIQSYSCKYFKYAGDTQNATQRVAKKSYGSTC